MVDTLRNGPLTRYVAGGLLVLVIALMGWTGSEVLRLGKETVRLQVEVNHLKNAVGTLSARVLNLEYADRRSIEPATGPADMVLSPRSTRPISGR